MLRLRLFGHGQAEYHGRPLVGFPGKQAYLLLCYILLNKDYPHHREQLANLFWEDQPTHIARKRLRTTLWCLRKDFQAVGARVEDHLKITDNSVAFMLRGPYWLDTTIFEATVTCLEDCSGQALTSDQAAELESAVELYFGDLLEGVYEDWVLFDRERYRLSYMNALSKLMIYHGLHGNYERGLSYGKRILARDSTRESVHRQMMWLFCLSGNRNAALDQYTHCCQILQDELGIPPMEETRRLHHQIYHNQFEAEKCLGDFGVSLLVSSGSTQPRGELVKHLQQKLQHLEAMNKESNAELRLISRLINQVLQNPE
jgi:DNA-binding SARP family transcriptional activator